MLLPHRFYIIVWEWKGSGDSRAELLHGLQVGGQGRRPELSRSQFNDIYRSLLIQTGPRECHIKSHIAVQSQITEPIPPSYVHTQAIQAKAASASACFAFFFLVFCLTVLVFLVKMGLAEGERTAVA